MTVTLANLSLHAQHATAVDSTTLPPGTTSAAAATQIVNQAGAMMLGAHPWNFRGTSAALLAFVAPITIANGTWTTSSKNLLKTSGFTSYTFAKGDIIEITDGTGATDGFYHIASKTDANNIVLSTDIGATTGSTDIDGTIEFPYVNLPSDFSELVSVEFNGINGQMLPTTMSEVVSRRYTPSLVNNGNFYYYAIVHPGQTAATAAQGVPRLELDHAPDTADPDALVSVYRRGWTTLVNGTDAAEIPNDFMFETLLIEYVRAVAEGYMNRYGDNDGILPTVSLNERYSAIARSDLFADCVASDGIKQGSYGPIRNSAVAMSRGRGRYGVDGDLYSTTTAVS